jgi:tol-pal system protein YbgF
VEVTFPADGGTKAPGDSGAVGKAKEREESMAKGDFDEAQRFWATKNYGRALEAFGDFVVRYPDHAKVDMALFRRGECYLAIGECGRASEQFLEVVRRFPDGKLAAESLFKVGVCQNQQGRSSEASQTFQRLARDYPRSEAARRIPREDHP